MEKFNTPDNLTHEAQSVLVRFIEREFNSIDQEALKLVAGGDYYFEEIEEVTPRTLRCDECNEEFEDDSCVEIKKDGESWSCEVYDGTDCPKCEEGDLEYSDDDEHGAFPMWGTLWKCSIWVENKLHNDVTIASEAGFRVYEVNDDLYLGVDGAGYDFYSAHWAPLYRFLFGDSPVKDGDKLPGDPMECPVCEGNTPPADSDEQICDECCGKGKVPFKSHEQLREEQREEALKLLRELVRLSDCGDGTGSFDFVEEARTILKMTEGC